MISSADDKITILVTGPTGSWEVRYNNFRQNIHLIIFYLLQKKIFLLKTPHALKTFFDKQPVDFCINCAAYTAVDKAESEKEKAFLINADAAGFLASTCSDHQTKLIHISTDYVYDGSASVPLKEEDAVAPLNVYGRSKLKGEELIPRSLSLSTYHQNFMGIFSLWKQLCKNHAQVV